MTWVRRPLQGLLPAVAVLLVLFGGSLAPAWGSPGSPSTGFASPVGTATTTLGAIAGDAASGPVEGGLPDIGPSEPDSPEADRGVEAVAPSGQLSAPRATSLPFKSPALRSQVDDVVRHFDEFGAPPHGVHQGGRGGIFQNREGLLPRQSNPRYYTESDVWPRTGPDRGLERLVFGQNGEVFYTPDHYSNFVRIR